MQNFADGGNDRVLSGEASRSGHAASQIAFVGIDNVNAAAAQALEIFLCRGMIPHVDVHRGGDYDRRSGREIKSTEKIVTDAAAELRNDVGSRRRDQKQIGALRNSNVFNGTFEIRINAGFSEQPGNYFFPGERGKGKRGDEFAGRAGHNYFD